MNSGSNGCHNEDLDQQIVTTLWEFVSDVYTTAKQRKKISNYKEKKDVMKEQEQINPPAGEKYWIRRKYYKKVYCLYICMYNIFEEGL